MSASDPAPRRPGPEHQALAPLVGVWETRGQVRASGSTPAAEIAGTDSYEWLPGGYFLLHRVDVRIGGEPVEGIEIIGWDAKAGAYFLHSYDSQGTASVMQGRVRDGVWTLEGDAERFTGGFGDGGRTLSGLWERREGAEWLPWMDVRLMKADG